MPVSGVTTGSVTSNTVGGMTCGAEVSLGLATLIYAATTIAGALSFLPGGLVVTEASMVVLLVWVYYSALIFFFGAEYTHAWGTRHHAVVPQPHAMPGVAPQTKSAAASEHTAEP